MFNKLERAYKLITVSFDNLQHRTFKLFTFKMIGDDEYLVTLKRIFYVFRMNENIIVKFFDFNISVSGLVEIDNPG